MLEEIEFKCLIKMIKLGWNNWLHYVSIVVL